MRMRCIALTGALLLASATLAIAQQDVLPSRPLTPGGGVIDIGARGTDITGDAARFQRFRDFGDGLFVKRFLVNRQQGDWLFEASAQNAGREDQRYTASFRDVGRVRASFEWNQVPLFYSTDTRTLYTSPSPGVFLIDDSIQRGIEARQLTLADVAGRATSFDTKSRRDSASFALVASATRELDIKVGFKTVKRDGSQPWGASLGFSNDIELAAPLDHRTTDVSAGIEWANRKGMFKIGYDGSWFDNRIQTLAWDNPIKFTDSTYAAAYSAGDGTSRGQMALWPSSNAHTVSSAASIKLPARSNLSGSVSVGTLRQNEPLLPFTVNTAIQTIHLERTTAEAEARTLATNFAFTSRPNKYVWLSARYRYNEFDNRTPHFNGEEYVRFDQVFEEIGGESEPFGFKRHSFNADASFTPIPFTALKVGYARETADRSFRVFEKTTEDIVRASLDTTGTDWVSFRTVYERSTRKGSAFDAGLLPGIGEQPGLRHFDIANRDRNRVTAILQLNPLSTFGISFSAGAGKDDYKESVFGLRDNEHRVYTIGFDAIPKDAVALGLSYGYENYTAFQRSRTASPGAQFVDPRRDWSTDSDDKVHTVNATFDLLKIVPKTELRFGYDFNQAKSVFVYGLAPDTTLPRPAQLPPIRNELQRGTADVRYFLTKNLVAGFVYWYDRYSVEDFALGTQTIDKINLPGTLLLGYVYRPYTANSVWGRLMYIW